MVRHVDGPTPRRLLLPMSFSGQFVAALKSAT
jgi:hypothetical protein